MPKWKPKCIPNRWKLSFGEVSKTVFKNRRQNDTKIVPKRSPGRPQEASKWHPNSIPNRVLEQVGSQDALGSLMNSILDACLKILGSIFEWFSVVFAVCFRSDISNCWHGCCIGHIRSFWWCWVVEFSSVGGWMACTIGCSRAEVGRVRSLLDVAYWIACWIACMIACLIACHNQPKTNKQRATSNEQQPTSNKQQATTNSQQPTTNNQQPTTNNKHNNNDNNNHNSNNQSSW